MEDLGQFLEFIGAIVASFSRSYIDDSRALVGALGEASLLDGFYIVVATAFLVGVCAVLVIGTVMSVIGRSPQPLIEWGERYVRLFGQVGAWIVVVLIGAMVYEVIARYFFGAPTQWAFEVAYMLMGTSFMLGIAYCLQMISFILLQSRMILGKSRTVFTKPIRKNTLHLHIDMCRIILTGVLQKWLGSYWSMTSPVFSAF